MKLPDTKNIIDLVYRCRIKMCQVTIQHTLVTVALLLLRRYGSGSRHRASPCGLKQTHFSSYLKGARWPSHIMYGIGWKCHCGSARNKT